MMSQICLCSVILLICSLRTSSATGFCGDESSCLGQSHVAAPEGSSLKQGLEDDAAFLQIKIDAAPQAVVPTDTRKRSLEEAPSPAIETAKHIKSASTKHTSAKVLQESQENWKSVTFLDSFYRRTLLDSLLEKEETALSGIGSFFNKNLHIFGYSTSSAGTVSWTRTVLYACVSWSIYLVLAVLIWKCCYPGTPLKVGDKSVVESPAFTIKYGHFLCFQDPTICLCACFCPGLRWADTMNLIGFLQMGIGLSTFFFCGLLNGLAFTTAIYGPFTLLLILYYRHKLRAQFGLPSFSCGSCLVDFMYILFCPWCAIAQEARAVRHHVQREG